MYYSARTEDCVDAVLAPFRCDATPQSATAHLLALSTDERADALEYAEANGIMGLLHNRLDQMKALPLLSADVQDRLDMWLGKAGESQETVDRNRREVLVALVNEGVQCLVLKGAAFGHVLYQKPEVRPTRDLDLLVPAAQLQTAQAALERIGFVGVGRRAKQHLPRMVRTRSGNERSFAVDLHDRLVPPVIYGVRVQPIGGLWERSIVVNETLCPFRTLGRRQHALHICVHLFHHVFYHFRLMHLVDLVSAMRCWSSLDWGGIAGELDRLGLANFRNDLWSWVQAFFGDRQTGTTSSDDSFCAGRWLLRHGSLPLFAGWRYRENTAASIGVFAHEARRAAYRSLMVPGWGMSSRGH